MISELTSKTISVIEKYFDFIKNEDYEKTFLLIFPSKKNIGISISLTLLNNFWKKDLDNFQNNTEYKQGDLLKIILPPVEGIRKNKVQRRARCISANAFSIKIGCKDIDQAEIPLKHYEKYIEIENGNFPLSNISDFIAAKNELFKNEVNHYTEFLGLDYYVNPDHLVSKIYFICGHGLVGQNKDFLNQFNLDNIFLDNQHFLLKENMLEFQDFFSTINEAQEDNQFFKETVTNKLFEIDDHYSEELLRIKQILLNKLNGNEFENSCFLKLYNDLISEFEDNDLIEQFSNLKQYLKVQDNLLDNIRCIIIENPELANQNQNIINQLVVRKIPVLILADRSLYKKNDRESLNIFLTNNQNCFILNWSRESISKIREDETESFWDNEALTFSKRFQRQRIRINKKKDNHFLDELFVFFELKNNIKKLEGFEQLKQDYYDYLRPVVYWFKNSTGKISKSNIPDSINGALNLFNQSFSIYSNNLKSSNLELYEKIIQLLNEFETFEQNSKTIPPDKDHIFNQKIEFLNDQMYFFESLSETHVFNISKRASKILFTGYPYKEYSTSFLNNAIFDVFIPEIDILAWCNEGNLIEKSIQKSLSIPDKIKDNLPNEVSLFKAEITPILEYQLVITGDCTDTDLSNFEDYESTQKNIESNIRFAKYSIGDSENLRKVKILCFSENRKVFIESKTKLLTLNGKLSFNECNWDEIQTGDKVFIYNLTRQMNIEMRPETAIAENLLIMDSWFVCLNYLIQESNYNFTVLESVLKKFNTEWGYNANPEIYNLRNWLNEERVTNVPDPNNLKLILRTLYNEMPNVDSVIENKMKKIYSAKKIVEKEDRRNRNEIKEAIKKSYKNASENFTIYVNNVAIEIQMLIIQEKLNPDNFAVDSKQIGIVI